MNSYEFAVELLKELDFSLRAPSNYKAIKCSATIRQLIFDKNQVLALAQQQSGKKFIFYVDHNGIEGDISQAHPCYVVHFLGNLDMEGGRIGVSIEEFGAMKVMYSAGRLFSIKDIIKYLANKRGGVHLDEKNLDAGQEIMDALSRGIELGGMEMLLQEALHIARATVNSARRSGYL
jgi:hypothetical protein